jgi:hypothetical protein
METTRALWRPWEGSLLPPFLQTPNYSAAAVTMSFAAVLKCCCAHMAA